MVTNDNLEIRLNSIHWYHRRPLTK